MSEYFWKDSVVGVTSYSFKISVSVYFYRGDIETPTKAITNKTTLASSNVEKKTLRHMT